MLQITVIIINLSTVGKAIINKATYPFPYSCSSLLGCFAVVSSLENEGLMANLVYVIINKWYQIELSRGNS